MLSQTLQTMTKCVFVGEGEVGGNAKCIWNKHSIHGLFHNICSKVRNSMTNHPKIICIVEYLISYVHWLSALFLAQYILIILTINNILSHLSRGLFICIQICEYDEYVLERKRDAYDKIMVWLSIVGQCTVLFI